MFNDYAVPIMFGLCIRFFLFAFWKFELESFDKGEFATITILEVKIPFRNSDNITADDGSGCPRKLVFIHGEQIGYMTLVINSGILGLSHWSYSFTSFQRDILVVSSVSRLRCGNHLLQHRLQPWPTMAGWEFHRMVVVSSRLRMA